MTSEEVKELLRQLSRDTEEVGDIRSRTIRIRLGGEEDESPQQENGEQTDTDAEQADARWIDTEPTGTERTQTAGAAGRSRAAHGRGFSADEVDEQEESEAESGDSSARKPRRLFARRSKREAVQSVGAGDDSLEEMEQLSGRGERRDSKEKRKLSRETEDADTRYMDSGEVKDRLEQDSAKKSRPVRKTASEAKAYPVEPAEFESDAWMFREEEADPEKAYHRRRLLSTAAARLSGRGKADGNEAQVAEEESAKAETARAEAEVATTEDFDDGKVPDGGFPAFLREKGIGLKQLSLIGISIVALIVVIAVILALLGSRRKRENVTADEGLRVSVEQEPARWSKSGEVELRIRTASPIQSVSVDGKPVTFSGQNTAVVSFEAASHEVSLMVVSEDETRNATVAFSKIDSEDPRIDVSFQDGQAVLTAVDDLSGVQEIWYGTMDAFSDVPVYSLYTGPFEPEKGRLYSYFATDKAGNVSTPVSTNLTPATAMALKREGVSLFPGETYTLELETTPGRAFLNGLTWSSSDPEVASVSDAGLVTAITDGEATIRAEAEGLQAVSCLVCVRSEVSVTISAVGDITLGEDISFSTLNNFTAVYAMNGPDYFLSNVREIFEADDITFANLEGTLTDQGTRANKEFAFRGDPSYTEILTSGSVEAVTLANNHSYDYGEISHTDTEKYLDEAGIEWCEGDKIIVKDVNGVRMALIGIYVLQDGMARAEQVESTIAEAKAQGAQLIVVAFHWGTERETSPDTTQRTLAHLAIDSGADLVVGHHPHVLQGIEKYSGKYICYSLGNFCFGGNTNPSDKDTMIFQQTFHIMRGGEVQTGGVSVVPCSVSSVSDWNDYRPTPATGAEAERIMEKINKLCEPFGTSF